MSTPCAECPFEYATSKGTGVDLGCLPGPETIVDIYNRGRTLSCHDDDTTPCRGLIRYLSERNARLDLSLAPLLPHTHWYYDGDPTLPRP